MNHSGKHDAPERLFRGVLLYKNQVCMFGNGKGFEVVLLPGDPGVEKTLVEEGRAFQDPPALYLRRHAQEDLQIVGIFEMGMVAVGTLDDGQDLGDDLHRRSQSKSGAVKGPIGKWSSRCPGQQHFLTEPLVIHVAAGLGEPVWGALFRTEKKVVHVDHMQS